MEQPLDKSTEEKSGIMVLHKAIDILEAFMQPPHQHTLTELVHLTGYNKNQVFRLLRTLEDRRLVVRDPETSLYRVGVHLHNLFSVATTGRNVVDAAAPVLDRLARETGESVHLIALEREEAICVDRREATHGLRLSARIGERYPLYAGACPKVILAHLPEQHRDRVLGCVLEAITPYTVVDPKLLRRELEVIGREGVAFSLEDVDLGANGIAAPIFDAEGRIKAGVSIAGPALRLTVEKMQLLRPVVVAAGEEISRRLGYRSTNVSPPALP